MPRRIDLDEAAFRDLWLAGVPLRDIANRFQLGADTLGGVRRRLGLPPRTAETRPRPRASSDPTPAEIAARAAEIRGRWDEATREKRRGFGEGREPTSVPDSVFEVNPEEAAE